MSAFRISAFTTFATVRGHGMEEYKGGMEEYKDGMEEYKDGIAEKDGRVGEYEGFIDGYEARIIQNNFNIIYCIHLAQNLVVSGIFCTFIVS